MRRERRTKKRWQVEPSMLLLSSWTAPELHEGTRKVARNTTRMVTDSGGNTCPSLNAIPSEIFHKNLLWMSKLVTFNASLRMTLCLLNSLQILLSSVSIVVLSAAVALLSQPSGTPVPLHQSERATVAKSSLIGRRWLNLLSCGSDESSPRKQVAFGGLPKAVFVTKEKN